MRSREGHYLHVQYMLTPINSHPAHQMCQELALPGTKSMHDPSLPSTSATDHPNATESVGAPEEKHDVVQNERIGAPEEELDIVQNERIGLENIFRMLNAKKLHCISNSNS